MHKHTLSRPRHPERGQTILLVALALVSLLGMAALAIDVVTLYVARGEVQRAADAAALAGAKAVADSGFTTLPASDTNFTDARTLAQTMAITAINATVNATPSVNLVAGAPPVLASSPVVDFIAHPGSFQVTVTLTRTNLPTFFSKIWGRSTASVTATAAAEAYNPSNLPTITPMALRSLKPWLVANVDPRTGTPFVNKLTGRVEDSALQIQTIDLVSDCSGTSTPCVLVKKPPALPPGATTPQVQYVPALVTDNTANVCPACSVGSDFEQSIACADANLYQVLSCGGGTTTVTWDNSVNPGGAGGDSEEGTECLIHATVTGLGKGQDELDASPWPNNPMQIKARSGPFNTKFVTTSHSIVTIPIIDNSPPFPISGNPLTVVGFMQAFINQIDQTPGGSGDPPEGSINVTVLNIAGCSTTANAANPIVGGAGTSPVPVRLITPP